MMRVRQASLRPNGEPSENENDSCEENGQYLKTYVYPYGPPSVPCVKTQGEDGSRYDQEKDNRCNDSMSKDNAVVAGHLPKTIPHS